MLGPALQQLRSDLSRAEPRSTYEETILEELETISRLLDDMRRRPWVITDLAGQHPLGSEISSWATRTIINRNKTDVIRLHCDKDDCPGKRI